MSLARLLQVRDMVLESQVDEQRRELLIRQEELRTLVSYIVASSLGGTAEMARAAAEGVTLLRPLDGDRTVQRPVRRVPLSMLRSAFVPGPG